MKGIDHEKISIFVMICIAVTLLYNHFYYVFIAEMVAAWGLQTLYINNDLDTKKSRSRGRIGYFTHLFIPFSHRGILHSPVLWLGVFLVFVELGHPWLGIGFFGSGLTHIAVDFVS